jgi:hypothetical protein
MKRKKCDKCGSDILMNRCSCGHWFERGEQPKYLADMEKIILEFNKSGKTMFGADHHSGSCIVLFKGSEQDLGKVVLFIHQLMNG